MLQILREEAYGNSYKGGYSMGIEEYRSAYKLGKKDYNARMMRGERPTLQVLDDILPPKGSYSEVPLGIVQIP